MYFNKFVTNDGRVLVDLTRGDVTEETLVEGAAAFDKTGKFIKGKMKNGVLGGIKDVTELPEKDFDLDSVYRITEEITNPGKHYLYIGELAAAIGSAVPYVTLGEFFRAYCLAMAGIEIQVVESFYEVQNLPETLEPSWIDENTFTLYCPQYILKESGECYANFDNSGSIEVRWLFSELMGQEVLYFGIVGSPEEMTEIAAYTTLGGTYKTYYYWKYVDGYWNPVTPILDVNVLPTSNILKGVGYRLREAELSVYCYVDGELFNYQELLAAEGIHITLTLIDDLENPPQEPSSNNLYVLKETGVSYVYTNGAYRPFGELMAMTDYGWADSISEMTSSGIYMLGNLGEMRYYAYKNSQWVEFVETNGMGGLGAFIQDENQETFAIPRGATELAPYLCYGRKYKEIIIPSTVKKIGEGCFDECSFLKTILFEGSSRAYLNIICHKGTIPEDVVVRCTSDSTIIEDGIVYSLNQDKASYSIAGVGKTTYVLEPKQLIDGLPVTSVRTYAFEYDKNLKLVKLPEGITSIGSRAFYGANLLKISLPTTLSLIGDDAFCNSTILEVENFSSLNIVSQDEETGNFPTTLKNVYSPTTGEQKLFQDGDFVFFSSENQYELITYVGLEKDIVLPSFEKRNYVLGQRCLSDTNVNKVVIPEGCTEIGDFVFYGASSLISITIPSTVRLISDSAFNCNRLFEVYNLSPVKIVYGTGAGRVAKHIYNSLEEESLVYFDGEYVFYKGELPQLVDLPLERHLWLPETCDNQEYALFDGLFSGKDIVSLVLSDNIVYIGADALPTVRLQNEVSEDNVTYLPSYNNSCFVVTSGDLSTTQVAIKDGVRFIGQNAFYKAKLENLILPEGLLGICYRAFDYCNALKSVELPSTLRYVGETAFRYCQFETVKISSVEAWAAIDFYNYDANPLIATRQSNSGTCTLYINNTPVNSNTEISIGGIKKIGCNTFRSLSLNKAIIEEGVEEIGAGAFQNVRLQEIVLPNSLKKVGAGGLSAYSSVTMINVPSYKAYCDIEFGDHQTPTYQSCTLYANGKQIDVFSLPEGITRLPPSLFYNRKDLKEITIPSTIDEIPAYCFAYSGVEKIILPDTMEAIRSYAFYAAPLEEIILPKNLFIIDNYAFYGCAKLKTVVVPQSVKILGNGVFSNCNNLGTVVFEDQISTVGSSMFSGTRLGRIPENMAEKLISQSSTFQGCKNLTHVTIPSSVKTVGYNAFYYCSKLFDVVNLSELTITAGGTDNGRVGKYAKNICSAAEESRAFSKGYYHFYRDLETTYLLAYDGHEKDLILPTLEDGEVYEIYESTFSGLNFIESVNIPEGVTAINAYAFSNCKSLKQINLPNSIQNLNSNAFEGCSSLEFEEYENGRYLGSGDNKHSVLFSIIDKTATEFVISDSAKNILPAACADCTSLTSLTLPSSLNSIGGNAFYNCPSLTEINISDFNFWLTLNFANSGANPCSNSSAVLRINGELLNLENYILPEISQIKPYAFYNQKSLVSLTLPSTLQEVGEEAFYGCSSLATVKVDNLQQWCNINFNNPVDASTSAQATSNPLSSGVGSATLYIGETPFSGEVVFGEEIASIGSGAFDFYSRLTSVTMLSDGIQIGDCAFRGTKIRTLVLPREAIIGKYAFAYVASYSSPLNMVSFLSKTKIGDYAFYKTCIYQVQFSEDITSIGEYAFASSYLSSISLPSSLEEIPCGLCKDAPISSIKEWGGAKQIGSYAFYNNRIPTLELKDSIEEIGEYAFSAEYYPTNIIIPPSIKKIGKYAFALGRYDRTVSKTVTIMDLAAWCQVEIETAQGSPFFSEWSDWYGAKPYNKLIINGEIVTDLRIPSGVTSISDYAFYGLNTLERIVLPEGVNAVGDYSFYAQGSNTTQLEIPSTLNTVGQGGFFPVKEIHLTDAKAWLACNFENNSANGCEVFTKIFVNNSLLTELTITEEDSLGNNSMYGYTYLFRVEVQGWPKNSGNQVFECPNLAEIKNLSSYFISIGSSSHGGIGRYARQVYKNDSDRKVFVNDSFAAYCDPNNSQSSILKYLGDSPEVSMPDTIEGGPYGIDAYAFYQRSDITSATIPEQILYIGNDAFSECNNLEQNIFAPEITKIGNRAFTNCSKITSFKLNKDMDSFGTEVYVGCTGAEYLTYPNVVTNISYNELPYTSVSGSYPNYVYHNSAIKGLYLSHNLQAFSKEYNGCPNLKRIDVDELDFWFSATHYSHVKYSPLCNHADLYLNNELVEELVVPEGVTRIPEYAFCGGTFKRVILSSTVQEIGEYAFYNCNQLEEVILPEGLTTIGQCAFVDNTAMTKITLPSTLTSIGADAFIRCLNLAEVQNLSSLPITKGSADHGYVAFYANSVTGADAE